MRPGQVAVASGDGSLLPVGHTAASLAALCGDPRALRVAPAKGSAVLFFSHAPDGSIDDAATHGGCPVRGGEKWIAQLWARRRATHDYPAVV